MVDWPVVRLKDCVDLIAGFAFKSERFTDREIDIPLVKGENVGQGEILWEISKRWPVDDCSIPDKYRLVAGDVVVAMDRPWVPAGLKWAFIRETDPSAYLVQRVARLRADGTQLDQGFLSFVIGGTGFERYIRPITTGVNIPHISGTQILSYAFALPPLPIQRRIASILSAYDDLIENNRKRIAILEEMARRLYREWFVDFRYPGHESVTFVDSPLGRIPQGWKIDLLGDYAEIVMGSSPDGDSYNDDGVGIPLVNGPVEFGELFTKKIKWTTSPRRLSAFGDLVVCVRGSTTGKYVKSEGVYCLGRGVCAIRHPHQSFINQAFIHILPALLGQTSGSTFPAWTGPQLKDYKILAPPSWLTEDYQSKIGIHDALIQNLSEQIDVLRRTRDLLLPRLMSGQLSVEAAEASVP